MSLLLNSSCILFLCLFALFSCSPKKIDKKLVGMENLTLIKGNKFSHPVKDQTVIIHYVNFDCSSCVQQIINWQNFFYQNNLDLESSLFIVGYGDYHRTLLVTNQIDFDGNILYDKNGEFDQVNISYDLKDDNCIIFKNNQYHQFNLNFYNKKDMEKLSELLVGDDQ